MTLMHFEVSVLALSISCAHSALNASNTVNFGYSMIFETQSLLLPTYSIPLISLENQIHYTYIVSETR